MDGKKCYIPVMCEGCGGSSGGFPGDEYIEIPLTYTAESNGYIYAVASVTTSCYQKFSYVKYPFYESTILG